MLKNEQYLIAAIKVAKESGKTFKKYFGNAGKTSIKNGNPRDVVTEIDRQIETHIRKAISKTFPQHKIIGEEFGAQKLEKNDFIWIIDPIDGTNNFIRGLSICCISIALWNQHGPLVAVVYNPVLNLLFSAERGKGAFLNNKKIKVSAQTGLNKSFGGYSWGRNIRKASQNFPKLIKLVNKIRTLGSTTSELALVACGVYDFHIHVDINLWDFAASILLIQEAGGKVTDWSGNKVNLETRQIAASNKKIHKEILKTVKKLA